MQRGPSKLMRVDSCRKRATCGADLLLGKYVEVHVESNDKGHPCRGGYKADRMRCGQGDIAWLEGILADLLSAGKARSVTPQ